MNVKPASRVGKYELLEAINEEEGLLEAKENLGLGKSDRALRMVRELRGEGLVTQEHNGSPMKLTEKGEQVVEG